MQKTLKNKFFLPAAILAIVGVTGAVYTITHSGPTSASAQTPSVQGTTRIGVDKETNDDNDIVKPSGSVQQKEKADANENEKADKDSNEVEDGK